jgi:GAF domain-containing protein
VTNCNEREAALRRQLTAFAQFTTRSLGESDLDALMTYACLRARAGVDVTHAKLLEYLPSRDRLILRAGVGWKDGYVGQYEIPPDLDTPIGHALALSEPVPVSDYGNQTKYRYPAILRDHGCVSSVNVPVQTDSGSFGVLEIDHTCARTYSADDIYFLTGLGNTIAQAVELKRALRSMAAAVDAKQLLVQEMNHRIKNNLSLVGAMLSLQARRFPDASMRIGQSSLPHQQLVSGSRPTPGLYVGRRSNRCRRALPTAMRDAAFACAGWRDADSQMQRDGSRRLRRISHPDSQ